MHLRRVRFSDRQALPVEAGRLRRLLAFALERLGGRDAVSLAIVDDPTIAGLNRRFLRREGPTDVMAFPLAGGIDPEPELGEIVVSADTAARQARELGHSFGREMDLLALHGLLHLLGRDDANPSLRRGMLRAAGGILREFERLTSRTAPRGTPRPRPPRTPRAARRAAGSR
jgi:rRNA maturation RNase YbeY